MTLFPVTPARYAVPSRIAWGPTALVAGVMLGWLIVLAVVSSFMPERNLIAAGSTLQIGNGVTVVVPSGWSRVSSSGAGLEPGVTIQKSGVTVTFLAKAYSGNTEDLFVQEIGMIQEELSFFRASRREKVWIGGYLQGLQAEFSGTSQGTEVEGRLSAVSEAGLGFVMLAYSGSGRLPALLPDVEDLMRSLRISG